MIHRVFDALDSLLSALVPVLYLLGLAFGTLAYFSGLVVEFDVAVGVCLAVAAEFHSYLVQRRMRMARARLNRATVADAAYGSLEAQYTRQRNILIALLAFSVYNSVQFVASTWTPTGWLPGPLQILFRGAVVPGLFYLAGELTPLITEPGDVLAHASREMTFAAVRTMSQQWRRRLRRARRRNLDLAPIAVTLLHDIGDVPGAARIRLIAEGLTAAEEGRMPLPPAPPANTIVAEIAPSQLTTGRPEDRPPTGPGSPVVITPAQADESSADDGRVVQLPVRPRRASTRRRAAASGRGARQSVEQRARAAWVPGMTAGELRRTASIGKSAASKYRKLFVAEDTQAQVQAGKGGMAQ